MKGFFLKKSSSKKHDDLDDITEPRSPTKPTKSSETKSPPKKTAKAQQPSTPASPTARESEGKPERRTPRNFTRQGTSETVSSSRKKTKVAETHPLNLPPEERGRLSGLSGLHNWRAMEVDKESPARATSSSPPPQRPSQPSQSNSFTLPVSNGTNGPANSSGAEEDEGTPAPPPHREGTSSPTAATPPDPVQDAENFKNEGNKFFKAKDYKQAISFYTKAVVLQPESATYLGNRAAAYMSPGRYTEALEDCKKAAELDPGNAKILLRLARIYTSLGQAHDAVTTFSRIHPPPSAKDMASAKEMLQYVRAAESALREGTGASMVLHPLDMAERLLGPGAVKPRKWQLMRGEALLKLGDANSLGEAQNMAMSLLRNNNQDPEALVLRGRALYASGENEKAIQHFRKALSCDPEFKDAIKWLRIVQKLDRMKEEGNGDYKAGRWQAAIDKYTAALEIDPSNKNTNSKILQNRALCQLQLKRYDGAIDDCEKAITLDPSYLKARKTKANALGQADKWEAAVREWKAIQDLAPEDRSVAKEIRRAELELKKSQRKDYYKILGVDKNADDNTIKKAYRRLAIVHHPDKNPGDAAAEERFKDISEAYETLSDSQKRARYDSGEDLLDPSDMFGGGGMQGGIDPEMLFSMMGQGSGFGGTSFGGGGFHFGDGGRPRQRGGFSSSNFHFS